MSDDTHDLAVVTVVATTLCAVALGSTLLLHNPPQEIVPRAGQRNHPTDATPRAEENREQPNAALERLPHTNPLLRHPPQPNHLIHPSDPVVSSPSPLSSSLESARETRVGGVVPHACNTGGPRGSVDVVPFPDQNAPAPRA